MNHLNLSILPDYDAKLDEANDKIIQLENDLARQKKLNSQMQGEMLEVQKMCDVINGEYKSDVNKLMKKA